jgi:hypothetical protein
VERKHTTFIKHLQQDNLDVCDDNFLQLERLLDYDPHIPDDT